MYFGALISSVTFIGNQTHVSNRNKSGFPSKVFSSFTNYPRTVIVFPYSFVHGFGCKFSKYQQNVIEFVSIGLDIIFVLYRFRSWFVSSYRKLPNRHFCKMATNMFCLVPPNIRDVILITLHHNRWTNQNFCCSTTLF